MSLLEKIQERFGGMKPELDEQGFNKNYGRSNEKPTENGFDNALRDSGGALPLTEKTYNGFDGTINGENVAVAILRNRTTGEIELRESSRPERFELKGYEVLGVDKVNTLSDLESRFAGGYTGKLNSRWEKTYRMNDAVADHVLSLKAASEREVTASNFQTQSADHLAQQFKDFQTMFNQYLQEKYGEGLKNNGK